jgi:glucokinase
VHPSVAVIAIAGPISNNMMPRMANVPKWGSLSGDELGEKLKIHVFKFINDF